MISPTLASFYVQDGNGLHSGAEFKPTSPAFNVQLVLVVCTDDPALGSEIFYARACSLDWIAHLGVPLPGFGYFVAQEWDEQRIGGMIQGVLDVCAAPSWSEVRESIANFAVSEFDSERFRWVRPVDVVWRVVKGD